MLSDQDQRLSALILNRARLSTQQVRHCQELVEQGRMPDVAAALRSNGWIEEQELNGLLHESQIATWLSVTPFDDPNITAMSDRHAPVASSEPAEDDEPATKPSDTNDPFGGMSSANFDPMAFASGEQPATRGPRASDEAVPPPAEHTQSRPISSSAVPTLPDRIAPIVAGAELKSDNLPRERQPSNSPDHISSILSTPQHDPFGSQTGSQDGFDAFDAETFARDSIPSAPMQKAPRFDASTAAQDPHAKPVTDRFVVTPRAGGNGDGTTASTSLPIVRDASSSSFPSVIREGKPRSASRVAPKFPTPQPGTIPAPQSGRIAPLTPPPPPPASSPLSTLRVTTPPPPPATAPSEDDADNTAAVFEQRDGSDPFASQDVLANTNVRVVYREPSDEATPGARQSLWAEDWGEDEDASADSPAESEDDLDPFGDEREFEPDTDGDEAEAIEAHPVDDDDDGDPFGDVGSIEVIDELDPGTTLDATSVTGAGNQTADSGEVEHDVAPIVNASTEPPLPDLDKLARPRRDRPSSVEITRFGRGVDRPAGRHSDVFIHSRYDGGAPPPPDSTPRDADALANPRAGQTREVRPELASAADRKAVSHSELDRLWSEVSESAADATDGERSAAEQLAGGYSASPPEVPVIQASTSSDSDVREPVDYADAVDSADDAAAVSARVEIVSETEGDKPTDVMIGAPMGEDGRPMRPWRERFNFEDEGSTESRSSFGPLDTADVVHTQDAEAYRIDPEAAAAAGAVVAEDEPVDDPTRRNEEQAELAGMDPHDTATESTFDTPSIESARESDAAADDSAESSDNDDAIQEEFTYGDTDLTLGEAEPTRPGESEDIEPPAQTRVADGYETDLPPETYTADEHGFLTRSVLGEDEPEETATRVDLYEPRAAIQDAVDAPDNDDGDHADNDVPGEASSLVRVEDRAASLFDSKNLHDRQHAESEQVVTSADDSGADNEEVDDDSRVDRTPESLPSLQTPAELRDLEPAPPTPDSAALIDELPPPASAVATAGTRTGSGDNGRPRKSRKMGWADFENDPTFVKSADVADSNEITALGTSLDMAGAAATRDTQRHVPRDVESTDDEGAKSGGGQPADVFSGEIPRSESAEPPTADDVRAEDIPDDENSVVDFRGSDNVPVLGDEELDKLEKVHRTASQLLASLPPIPMEDVSGVGIVSTDNEFEVTVTSQEAMGLNADETRRLLSEFGAAANQGAGAQAQTEKPAGEKDPYDTWTDIPPDSLADAQSAPDASSTGPMGLSDIPPPMSDIVESPLRAGAGTAALDAGNTLLDTSIPMLPPAAPESELPTVGPARLVAPGGLGDLTGLTLGSLVIRHKLGTGSIGSVYIAYERDRREDVIVKHISWQLTADAHYVRRLEDEMKLAVRIKHPNVVRVFQLLEVGRDRLVVGELAEGDTLRQVLARHHRLMEEQVVDIATSLLRGLAAGHHLGLIHGDLRPANVFIGEHGSIRLADWGAAHDTEGKTATTLAGQLLVDPNIMAPELARGMTPNERTDLWALGVLLYECLTGVKPFDAGTPHAVLVRVATEEPKLPTEINPNVSPTLEAFVLRLLDKKRSDRIASTEEALQWLRQWSPDLASRERAAFSDRVPTLGRDSGRAMIRDSKIAPANAFGRPPISRPRAKQVTDEGAETLQAPGRIINDPYPTAETAIIRPTSGAGIPTVLSSPRGKPMTRHVRGAPAPVPVTTTPAGEVRVIDDGATVAVAESAAKPPAVVPERRRGSGLSPFIWITLGMILIAAVSLFAPDLLTPASNNDAANTNGNALANAGNNDEINNTAGNPNNAISVDNGNNGSGTNGATGTNTNVSNNNDTAGNGANANASNAGNNAADSNATANNGNTANNANAANNANGATSNNAVVNNAGNTSIPPDGPFRPNIVLGAPSLSVPLCVNTEPSGMPPRWVIVAATGPERYEVVEQGGLIRDANGDLMRFATVKSHTVTLVYFTNESGEQYYIPVVARRAIERPSLSLGRVEMLADDRAVVSMGEQLLATGDVVEVGGVRLRFVRIHSDRDRNGQVMAQFAVFVPVVPEAAQAGAPSLTHRALELHYPLRPR